MISAPNMPFDVMLSLDRAPPQHTYSENMQPLPLQSESDQADPMAAAADDSPARRAEYAMVQSDGEKVRVSACHKLQYLLIGTSLDSYTRCLSRSSAWIRSQLSA